MPKPDVFIKRCARGFSKIAEGSLEVQGAIKSGQFGVYQQAFIDTQRENYDFALEQLLKLGPLFEDPDVILLDEDDG